jgi:hypothetical protein
LLGMSQTEWLWLAYWLGQDHVYLAGELGYCVSDRHLKALLWSYPKSQVCLSNTEPWLGAAQHYVTGCGWIFLWQILNKRENLRILRIVFELPRH